MKTLEVAASAVLILTLAILVACSSQPTNQPAPETSKPSAEAKKEPALYTALQCYKRLEGQAHLWAADAKPVHVESDFTSESSGQSGKSAVWRGVFASATRRAAKSFSCSGSLDPDAPVFGLSADMEMAYDPRFVAFDGFLLKTDSDQAYELAQKHGGEALLKKDPQQPVAYLAEMTRGQSVPYWYVIYGRNLKDNHGIVIVNGTTGAFIRATR